MNKKIKIILVNTYVLIIIFILFEVSLSIFGYNKNQEIGLNIKNLGGIKSENPILLFEPQPNFENGRYKLNSDGLRDIEHQVEKESYRIAILGDSITYGVGVEQDETFTSRLNKELGKDVEVINFGFGGYNTAQESEYLAYKVKKYNPDLIILQYTLNDFEPIVQETNCKINLINLPVSCDLKKALTEIRTLYLIRSAIYGLQPHENDFSNLVKSIALNEERWNEDVRNPLQKFYDNSMDITENKPLLIITPLLLDFNNYEWNYLHGNITIIANEIGFEVIDLFPYFSEFEYKELTISEFDSYHPNKLGHEIMAEVIKDKIESNWSFLL